MRQLVTYSMCKFLEVINNCNNGELLKQHRLITPRLKDFYELIAIWLGELLKDRYSMFKSVLLDQKIIAGMGNACSDEILWAAGIELGKSVNFVY